MKKNILTGMSMIASAGIGAVVMGKRMNEILCDKQKSEEKFRIMYQMMERWMRIKQKGGSLVPYFETYDYKKVAIYGMGDIGKLLLKELANSNIVVAYAIDKNVSCNCDIQVYSPDNNLEEVDAVIVTAIAYYDEIANMMENKLSCPIVSLEDIVYEVV